MLIFILKPGPLRAKKRKFLAQRAPLTSVNEKVDVILDGNFVARVDEKSCICICEIKSFPEVIYLKSTIALAVPRQSGPNKNFGVLSLNCDN